MKPILELAVLLALVMVLSFAGSPFARAQHSDAPKVGSETAAELERLRATAAEGDAEAQFRLGELYEAGEVVERDPDKALEAYRQAAEQGHAGAQYALAHIYHLGSGVEQDMAAALTWYRKAALQGDEWSQLALGDQYRIGLVVPRDPAQATKWYRMAADQGNAFAQYELGNAYRYGHGVERDTAQAAAWYRRSAEAGNPSAQLALAELEAGDREAPKSAATLAWPDAPRDPVSANESVPPDSQWTVAAAPSFGDEQTLSQLLAHAEYQVANLALTTPAGDNAYETYQRILLVEPGNAAALDGIERIGVKYVELAGLAAAKGDFENSRQYAAKASVLAPEHPAVLSMPLPFEPALPASGETALTEETLAEIKTPPRLPNERQEDVADLQVAVTTPATGTPEDLIEDVDDVVFKPYDYRGRQVAVAGSVVHLFWTYRLIADNGQNSIVIDTDGLSPADRDKLAAAFDQVGFLGPVRVLIKGTVELGRFATYELAATEVMPGESAPPWDEDFGPVAVRYFGGVDPAAFSIDSDASLGETSLTGRRTRSGDRDSGNSGTASADGGGSDGTAGGGSGGSGGGADAGGGDADGASADSGNSGGGSGDSDRGDRGGGNRGGGNRGRDG